jgi:hypothetical protein
MRFAGAVTTWLAETVFQDFPPLTDSCSTAVQLGPALVNEFDMFTMNASADEVDFLVVVVLARPASHCPPLDDANAGWRG